MQDWKVGHILGGTPWRMQIGGLIGVVAAALVLILPIMLLDKVPGNPSAHAIGSDSLPAPQAGLMAMMSKGIVSGEMAWPLVIAGMFFAVALILIKSPSPMLIAVGMYLPFRTTAAIFVGGIIKYFVEKKTTKAAEDGADEKKLTGENRKTFIEAIKEKSENIGLLLASGLVAGEAITGILLAIVVGIQENLLNGLIGNLDADNNVIVAGGIVGTLLYFGVLIFLAYIMIRLPLSRLKETDN
jgi:putative OPT family oligopeptide transporter